jgi:hypothetical protein
MLRIFSSLAVTLSEIYGYVKQPKTDMIAIVKQAGNTRLNAAPV